MKNVAAQSNFHTLEGAEQPDAFERLLSELEGDAINIIRRIEAGEFPLPAADRGALSFFFALQAVRGPETRRSMEMGQAQMIRLEIGAGGRANVPRWVEDNLGFSPSAEQVESIWSQATQPGGPPIQMPAEAHIAHMVEMAEGLTNYFAMRPWSLVRFDRRSLITCDAPVSLVRHPTDDPWDGVGFATAWGIAIPLTRKLGLLMSDPMVMVEAFGPDDRRLKKIRDGIFLGSADRVERGSTAMEKLFNLHTAESAREYIYRHPDDEDFEPDELHEPALVNIAMHGLVDVEFDGEPWFERKRNASTDSRRVVEADHGG